MTTQSTRITVPITDANGGQYQISYERPGPVSQAEVEHDLAELAANLVSQDAEIGEATDARGPAPARTGRGPTTVAGETTTHVKVSSDRSVIVNVLDRAAILDYFDGTADEAVRVMIIDPDDDTTAVFLSIYETGWVLSHDGRVEISD
jgi:hypothetical protein